MTARQEVEEIAEQAIWAERNGLEPAVWPDYLCSHTEGPSYRPDRPGSAGGVYYPPAELLAQHEAKHYRSEPKYDAEADFQFVPTGWVIAAVVVLVAFAAGFLGFLFLG